MNKRPDLIYQGKVINVDPLLKWPGGKRFLLKYIYKILPNKFNKYYEPFLGEGALFFALHPNKAFLSDINYDLINCYKQINFYPNKVIDYLKCYKNIIHDYYNIRNNIPDNDIKRAARLIYLTSLSFNGIYRTNLRGKFNVPYGYKTHINPCDPDKILKISHTLLSADIQCFDFEESIKNAGKGDLIYTIIAFAPMNMV